MVPGLVTIFGNPSQAVWFTSAFTIGAGLAFLLCYTNSDLFGRRYFLIGGNLLSMIGMLVAGSAKGTSQIISGMSLMGFGCGLCQMTMIALPELLPNKWRHIGIVAAELLTGFLTLIVGPVVARIAISRGSAWRWIYYGDAIGKLIL